MTEDKFSQNSFNCLQQTRKGSYRCTGSLDWRARNGRSSPRRTRKICTLYTRGLGRLLDSLLQQECSTETCEPGELECYPRDMETEACPSQEDTLSKVHRDRQALAQNLRVRTRKTRPEGAPLPARQDKKNNLLASPLRSFFVLSNTLLDKSLHKRGRDRLVRREVDRGTADLVPFEFSGSHARQFGNHAGAHREERAMLLGRSEADQRAPVELENWNPVADHFGCIGCCGLDDLAKLFESAPHFLW